AVEQAVDDGVLAGTARPGHDEDPAHGGIGLEHVRDGSTVYVPRKELHLRQALEESTALVLAQSMDPAGLADRQLVHQPAGLDLADTGQRLQHGHDLHLPDNLVAIALLERPAERDRPEAVEAMVAGQRAR